MFEDTHFRRNVVVKVDAAVAGISRLRWDTAGPDWSDRDALTYMREKQYDVLPIAESDHVRRYFATAAWNDYSAIERKLITHYDTVHFDTPIRDVIKLLALERRNFVFLSSEREIVGLLSVVNLNCRQVKTYVYNLLNELETSLADLLDMYVNEENLKSYILEEALNRQRKGIRSRFNEDVANGVAGRFLEYVYLSDIKDSVVRFGLCKLLGFAEGDFNTRLDAVCKLRNRVAHPTKPLVSSVSTPKRLWHCIDTIEEILFQVKHLDKVNVKNLVGVSLD